MSECITTLCGFVELINPLGHRRNMAVINIILTCILLYDTAISIIEYSNYNLTKKTKARNAKEKRRVFLLISYIIK